MNVSGYCLGVSRPQWRERTPKQRSAISERRRQSSKLREAKTRILGKRITRGNYTEVWKCMGYFLWWQQNYKSVAESYLKNLQMLNNSWVKGEIDPKIKLEKTDVLTILNLPTHEYEISLHLVRYLTSSIRVCSFFSHIDLAHSLLDLYLKYFTFLVLMQK